MMEASLGTGLNAFADQFRAQVEAAGAPGHEHPVHFCLALGLLAAYDLAPGSVVFERPLGAKRVDLWVAPWDLAIEVKYQRPIPSGSNRPFPQLFGGLLADFNKVANADADQRAVVFVVDEPGIRYVERNSRGLLALSEGETSKIDTTELKVLSTTAANNALEHGAWTPLDDVLIWRRRVLDWHLLVWRINPRRAAESLDRQEGRGMIGNAE